MEEIEENSLEFAKKFKKYLLFDVGDIVYLKSDLKKNCPMVICKVILFDDEDYVCEWMTSQKDNARQMFSYKVLCK